MFLSVVILALAVPPSDSVQVVQRLRSITSLAAQEYALGVADGKVIAAEEVEEARLFFEEARRTAERLPASEARRAVAGIDSLVQLVTRTASPDSVTARTQGLMQGMAARLHVPLDEVPPPNPSLATGAAVYARSCAACHGESGKGDGFAGRGLTPPPTDLTNRKLLADATLLDFYRRVTIGVAGTAMPSFEHQLTADERWAVAAYAGTLRVPQRSRDSLVAYVPIFAQIRRQLSDGISLAANGDTTGATIVMFDAYMTFEQVEREVRTRNAGLATRIEGAFTELRLQTAAGVYIGDLEEQQGALLGDLLNAERLLTGHLSPFNLFSQSVVLLVREGLEAILVVSAILAFLTKTGARHRRLEIHAGVGAAIGASVITAFALEYFFRSSRVGQETLEGVTMLVAAAVLFYVSYWLFSKLEVAKWNRFLRGQIQDATTKGSSLALVSVAFLAVYREGFETVLFYKALLFSAPDALIPVAGGMAVGAVILGVTYFLINRYGVRLPLKPFFAVTSAFLYYMAFVFAGNGIAELQEGRVVGTTVVRGWPQFPAMGIYPTIESLVVQGLLLAALIVGLVWTFVIAPRRAPPAPEPEPVPEPRVKRKRRRSSSSRQPVIVEIHEREKEALRTFDGMEIELKE